MQAKRKNSVGQISDFEVTNVRTVAKPQSEAITILLMPFDIQSINIYVYGSYNSINWWITHLWLKMARMRTIRELLRHNNDLLLILFCICGRQAHRMNEQTAWVECKFIPIWYFDRTIVSVLIRLYSIGLETHNNGKFHAQLTFLICIGTYLYINDRIWFINLMWLSHLNDGSFQWNA